MGTSFWSGFRLQWSTCQTRASLRPATREVLLSDRWESAELPGRDGVDMGHNGKDTNVRTHGGDALTGTIDTSTSSKERDRLARHQAGACKPCVFVKMGCEYGDACSFCHLPHTRSQKPKLAKEKRMRIRKMMQRALLEAAVASSLPDGSSQLPPDTRVAHLSM